MPTSPKVIDRSFFARNSEVAARELIGCELKIRDETWTIVECEAYGDETDLASHAAVYHRARGDVMRREPGRLYVYRSYGVHSCLNIVTHEPDEAGAILIRALEPAPTGHFAANLRACSGPGRLTRTLGIDLAWDNLDLLIGSPLQLVGSPANPVVATSRRIGITRDVDRLWRFFDPESPSVSGSRAQNTHVLASTP